MKKILLLLVFAVSFSVISFAQVTKADVQKMMTEINTSADKIVKLHIYNTQKFYSDGTYTKTYSTYSQSNGDYTNSIGVYDSGIALQTKNNGVEDSRSLYPYSSISYIEISKDTMWIYLKD